MKSLQDLVTYFDRKGKLSRRRLRLLLDTQRIAADAPASGMSGLCGAAGATYYFRVTGAAEGQIWGTDVYTRDSSLGAAAVHAGLLKPGETGVMRVVIVPARENYPGSTRNGVTTSDYAAFPEAWRISAI